MFITISLIFCSLAFAHDSDDWGINKKTKTIRKTSRMGNVTVFNKRKANKRMDEALLKSELNCTDAGWKFTLISRKGKTVHRRGWEVTSKVSCEKI